jgi:hypothetical protein
METAPRLTMTTARTLERIGRPMKNLENPAWSPVG